MTTNERLHEYVRCRVFGHKWDEYDSSWTPLWGDPITVRCERCTTERRDTIGNNELLIQRHYEYPDDYKLAVESAFGVGKPTHAEMRRWLIDDRITAQRKQRSSRKRKTA